VRYDELVLTLWTRVALSGLRDPSISKVLAILHGRPAYPWTLNELAGRAGMKRAALAARFMHLVGHAPMEYLMLWRMQIAARLLADGRVKVATVGCEIGYDLETAFSRAFKKIVGLSPAAWREGCPWILAPQWLR
jgi:transcriptional regulator GlxA family with amidase domain